MWKYYCDLKLDRAQPVAMYTIEFQTYIIIKNMQMRDKYVALVWLSNKR